MPKCDLCGNEADYTVSSHDPNNDLSPWRHIFLCIVCLSPALIALLVKLGLIVMDLHTGLKVVP